MARLAEVVAGAFGRATTEAGTRVITGLRSRFSGCRSPVEKPMLVGDARRFQDLEEVAMAIMRYVGAGLLTLVVLIVVLEWAVLTTGVLVGALREYVRDRPGFPRARHWQTGDRVRREDLLELEEAWARIVAESA